MTDYLYRYKYHKYKQLYLDLIAGDERTELENTLKEVAKKCLQSGDIEVDSKKYKELKGIVDGNFPPYVPNSVIQQKINSLRKH